MPFFLKLFGAPSIFRKSCGLANSENGPYVDEVNIGELELYEGQRILYLLDYGDSWEFNIVLEKIDSSSPLPLNPKIVEKKGKATKQYRYF